MPTFSFENGSPSRSSQFNQFTNGMTFTEDGVTFTWSITNGGGDNSFGYQGAPVDPNGVLYFNFGNAAQTFTFDVTDPGTAFSGDVTIDFRAVTATVTVGFHLLGGGTIFRTTNGTGSVTASGLIDYITFTSASVSGVNQIESITVQGFNCFVTGTRIATPGGAVPVESLQPGDSILRADGSTTSVRWLGRQRIAGQPETPPAAMPVRIRRGALGQGLPQRDLCLSPDHAIARDGHLVNASALVNGTTITRDRRSDPFTYFHVETDAHELILAEGVPAETYLEHLAPQEFDNARAREPRVVPEMDLPRITSRRLLPRCVPA